MTVLIAEDMHCEKCVERIDKALGKAGLDYEVSLEHKSVTINGCDQCVATAKEILEDLGFETYAQQ